MVRSQVRSLSLRPLLWTYGVMDSTRVYGAFSRGSSPCRSTSFRGIMNKICSCCDEDKDVSNFYRRKRKKGLSYYSNCKRCLTNKAIQRKKSLKVKAVEYKGGKCQMCGYDKYIGALEFHHRDPLKKDISFGKLRKRKWVTYRDELDKCDMVCSNCHSEIHHKIDIGKREERIDSCRGYHI